MVYTIKIAQILLILKLVSIRFNRGFMRYARPKAHIKGVAILKNKLMKFGEFITL